MISKTDSNRSDKHSSLAGIVMFLMVALALVSNQTHADEIAVDEDRTEAQQAVSSEIQKLTLNISIEVAKNALTPPELDITRVRFGEDEDIDEDELLVADADK
jgi:hypothetical protein